jgi:hypothetical protein
LDYLGKFLQVRILESFCTCLWDEHGKSMDSDIVFLALIIWGED